MFGLGIIRRHPQALDLGEAARDHDLPGMQQSHGRRDAIAVERDAERFEGLIGRKAQKANDRFSGSRRHRSPCFANRAGYPDPPAWVHGESGCGVLAATAEKRTRQD